MNDIEYIQYLRKQANILKFSFPANFKKSSSKRLLRCYNGIGAEWMPEHIRKFISDIFFTLQAAALIHDFEYTHGKKSYWNFTVANVRFAYNAARSHRLIIGIAGALLCQVFGWYAYTHSKEVLSHGTP